MTDYWAHKYFSDPKAREEVEDDDFNLEAELAKLEADGIDDVDDFEEITP